MATLMEKDALIENKIENPIVKIETKIETANQEFTGTIPSNNIDIALKIISTTYHLESIKKNNLIILDSSNESK